MGVPGHEWVHDGFKSAQGRGITEDARAEDRAVDRIGGDSLGKRFGDRGHSGSPRPHKVVHRGIGVVHGDAQAT